MQQYAQRMKDERDAMEKAKEEAERNEEQQRKRRKEEEARAEKYYSLYEEEYKDSKKFSDEAIELFNQYYKETDNLIQDRASAIDKASKETLVIMEGNILQNKRIKLQTMMAKLELNDFLENAKDPYKALIDVGNIRLAQQEKVVMSQIKAPLDQFFYTFMHFVHDM